MSELQEAQEAYNNAEHQFHHALNQKAYWEQEVDCRNAAAGKALDRLTRLRASVPHAFNDANRGYLCCQEPGCGKHRGEPVHHA